MDLGQGIHVIGHMPSLFDAEVLIAGRIRKGRHLGARDPGGDAGEDIPGVVAGSESPGLGQVARPRPIAIIVFEPLDRIPQAFLAVAFGASVIFQKKLFTLFYALRTEVSTCVP